MDDRSGHLVADIDDVAPERRKFYRKLEGIDAVEASKELAGRKSVMVDISGNSRLAKSARRERAIPTGKPPAEKPGGRAAQRRLRQMEKLK